MNGKPFPFLCEICSVIKLVFYLMDVTSIQQIVCSFLVRDMGLDWRMGAEWFETCLLDYDPCSNYGNWTYGAGDTYFMLPVQNIMYAFCMVSNSIMGLH